MVELLRYLEANGFMTFIASGGDRDFMRPVTNDIYGIPPERVVGSSNALQYVEDLTAARMVYLAKPDVFDDGPVKPVRIWSRIGRRPILAFGNSNGDIQMLQFTGGKAPRASAAPAARRQGARVRLRRRRREVARAREGAAVDGRQHEERLEGGFRVRIDRMMRLCALVVLWSCSLASGCSGESTRERAAPAAQPPAPASRSAAVVERGATKKAIVDFVARVTTEGGPGLRRRPPERIAIFDNDGTLWSEQPLYFQLAVRARSGQGAGAAASGVEDDSSRSRACSKATCKAAGRRRARRACCEIMAATHAGIHDRGVRPTSCSDWIATARHPMTQAAVHRDGLPADAGGARLPARERLQDLHRVRRRRGVHAAVGRGVYGIPPEQVVGSRAKVKYECATASPCCCRLAELDLVDDKAGKPVGIQQLIGRRPIAAFGNSDGDFEMLEWTTSGAGTALRPASCTTPTREREWAYDRTSHIGKLARGLDEAPEARLDRWST